MKMMIRSLLFSSLIVLYIENSFCLAQANLQPISDSIHFYGNPGLTFVSVTIKNTGDTASTASDIVFYITIDSDFVLNDSGTIWFQSLKPIAAGETFTIDTNINLCDPILILSFPRIVQYGLGWNLGYIVDASHNVNESNELDNQAINSTNISLLCTVGINEATEEDSWFVFPNPANDFINFDFSTNKETTVITIYDIGGRILESFSPIANNPGIDISNLEAGYYYVRCGTFFKKFLKL